MHPNEVLKGRAVIVYLYLFIQSDYPYNIAKAFERVEDKLEERRKKNFPTSLTNPSHVSAILSQLEKEGFVIKEKEKKVEGQPRPIRSYYKINGLKLEDLDVIRSQPEEDISEYLIQKIREKTENVNKDRMIERIISIEKFDYITVLLYFYELINFALYKVPISKSSWIIKVVDIDAPDQYISQIRDVINRELYNERFPKKWSII